MEQGLAQEVVALVRPTSNHSVLQGLGIAVHECDLESPDTYRDVVTSGSIFVEMANLRHADRMLPHMIEGGIAHAFCVTTTAVFSSFHSYVQLYRDIEARLLSQPIPVALLRPSMIYGNQRDHNMHKLIGYLERFPVFPVFGPGTALMQPVFVDDLAEGIVAAIRNRVKGPFNLAGPAPLTYNELLREVSDALDKNVRLVHVNHSLVSRMVRLLENVPGFPIRHEQVMRLLEDKAFDISESRKHLGYAPRPFSEGVREEIRRLRVR